MKAITVCVEYDDVLAITLPRNARHFERVLVITTPDDHRTQAVVRRVPNACWFCTDAFYRNGAAFNKGAAIEEGFDAIGRSGWIAHLDADVILPERLPVQFLAVGFLYLCRRRMFPPIGEPPDDWSEYPIQNENPADPGYFQLFHADDPALRARPWYPTEYRHAGCSDSFFNRRWREDRRVLLPFEVLHLGEPFKNWQGRVSRRADGSVPPQAGRRAEAMRRMWKARGQAEFADRYAGEKLE